MNNIRNLIQLAVAIAALHFLQACAAAEGTVQAFHLADSANRLIQEMRAEEQAQESPWDSVTEADLAKVSNEGLCGFEKHEKVLTEILRRGIICP